MRIAVVAGEYPSPRAPERAMFVRDQVDALRAADHDVTVVHHEPPTLRRLVNAARRRLASRAAAPTGAPVTSAPGAGDGPVLPTSPTEATAPASAAAAAPASAPVPARARRLGRLRTAGRVVHDRTGQSLAEAAMLRDLARLDPAPDVVHAHNVFPAGAAAVRYGRRAGVPVVLTEHSSAFRRGQLAPSEVARARRLYDACAAVVAVSPSQAEALPAADVVVIGNVVPTGFDLRRPDAAASGDVVSIGTLMAHKGMDALLRAYAGLPPELQERHGLVLVGDGPDAPRLRALAAELGIGARVRFTGHVPRAQVAEIVRGAAVLVSASPVETFGVTLLEGLSAGVPFVAVRSGGPESVWFPGAGVLVPTTSADDLARGLVEVLGVAGAGRASDVTDADRRRLVHERFGADAVADRLRDLYRDAVAGRDARTAR